MSLQARQRWMSVLARADQHALAMASDGLLPAYVLLRGPEAGLIMLTGRAGGNGSPFNVGEASVARCSVRSANGFLGHSYCLGRELRKAELAAAVDAGLQDPVYEDALSRMVIEPLAVEQERAQALTGRRAAATRVRFFAMATTRG